MEIPDELIKDLLPAVQEQMAGGEMPFVNEAFDKLINKEQLPEEEALELIAQALAITVNTMVTSGKPFDVALYKSLLKQLPSLPDES